MNNFKMSSGPASTYSGAASTYSGAASTYSGAASGAASGGVGSMAAADALRKSRDAIVTPGDASSYPLPGSSPPFPDFVTIDGSPPVDLLNRLAHWDDWVVVTLCLPELMRLLTFTTAAGKARVTMSLNGTAVVTSDRPSIDTFRHQLKDVIADAELREDRASEILMQVNDTWSFWATILPLGADKTPATTRLMMIAHEFAIQVHMRFKHEFACARPEEYSPQVQPMIRTPGHGTYPMGHGCEAAMTAAILSAVTQPTTQPTTQPAAWNGLVLQMQALANRIGDNRIVAGLHFQIDLEAGLALGKWLGDYFISCCKLATATVVPLAPITCVPRTGDQGPLDVTTGTAQNFNLPAHPDLNTVWIEARKEWAWINR